MKGLNMSKTTEVKPTSSKVPSHIYTTDKVDIDITTKPTRKEFEKKNYIKIDLVKDKMLGMIEQKKYTSAKIAHALNISLGTFHKYKSLLQLFSNNPLATIDEMMYLKNRNIKIIE
jgi:hypothetical protein